MKKIEMMTAIAHIKLNKQNNKTDAIRYLTLMQQSADDDKQ